MPLLQVKDLTKYFGGLAALDRVSFMVNEGEIIGLIGPNGAGKTTLFNIITGFISPTKGDVFFKGQNITGIPPHRVTSRGIGRTFQLATFFGEMTVFENILIALHLKAQQRVPILSQLVKGKRGRNNERQILNDAHDIVTYTGLESYINEKAINLPHGFQRLLSIAIGMATSPELLLLDEVAGGMNAEEIQSIMTLLSNIHRQGKTLIIIEHNMRLVMRLCERFVVLNHGRKIADGKAEDIVCNEEVITAYLGKERDIPHNQ